jgi:dTMP kinase
MGRGLFVSFEGPDGSGKSTQSKLLYERLSEKGHAALLLREPGGTDIGEQIRRVILDSGNVRMDCMAEAMLYAAARAQLVAETIRPALEGGKIVVCDRFADSSVAYQGFARGLGAAVEAINAYAVGGCTPDLTFLLNVPPELGEKRREHREGDRIENEGPEYHRAVCEAYMALERRFPSRIVGIDGTGDVLEISAAIAMRVERLLGERQPL